MLDGKQVSFVVVVVVDVVVVVLVVVDVVVVVLVVVVVDVVVVAVVIKVELLMLLSIVDPVICEFIILLFSLDLIKYGTVPSIIAITTIDINIIIIPCIEKHLSVLNEHEKAIKLFSHKYNK